MEGPGHCGLRLLPALSPSPDKDTSPGCDPKQCRTLPFSRTHIRTQMMSLWARPALTSKNISLLQASVLPVVVQLPSCVRLFATPWTGSTPGLSVPYHLPEFAQVHVHCISDAVQPSHTQTPSSPSALHLSQPQGLFQWVVCSHQMTKILELQL